MTKIKKNVKDVLHKKYNHITTKIIDEILKIISMMIYKKGIIWFPSVNMVKYFHKQINEQYIGNVNIYVSRNAGGVWGAPITTVAHDSSPFEWLVTSPETTDAMVKVASATYPSDIKGESPTFEVRQVITVDRPLQDEVWRYGTQRNVEWTLNGGVTGDKVKIFYKYDGGTWLEQTPVGGVTALPDQSGSWSWNIPNTMSSDVYVRIEDSGLPKIYHESDQFKIKANINVTDPAGDEIVKISDTAETYAIQWDIDGSISGYAKIMLSKNSGGSNHSIIDW